MVPPEVKGPQVGEVPDLDGEVGDLVAAHVELHQLRHQPDLLRQADQLVVVRHQALQLAQRADGGGKVGQCIPTRIQASVNK